MDDRAGEGQEREAVIQREQQHDDAEHDERRRAVREVAAWDVTRAFDLDQQPQQPQREGKRGELADDVEQVMASAGPPAGGHAPAVFPAFTPLSVTLSPVGRGDQCFGAHSLLPKGRTNRIVVSSLVCWIALAGSTAFGQTTEHSPTKLHSQTPSVSAMTGSLCVRPSSRESRL